MDIVLMIIYCVLILGFLVVIHEGGHYFMARAFGVRVSEFMVGLPGPNIGFTAKNGTKYGITAVPLGGYARVCGMEPGDESPYLEDAAAIVFREGTVNMDDVAAELHIAKDDAYTALSELEEWGTIAGPHRKDKYNTFRTKAVFGDKGRTPVFAEGTPQKIPASSVKAFIDSERKQQYRSLPFWKRSMILIAGPGVNVLCAILLIVLLYSVIGVDMTTAEGEVQHVTISPLRSLEAGFIYTGMVIQAVAGLFNPQTAAQVVSDSTSVVGIAVMSKQAVDQGFASIMAFTAMISVSLGIMNMLPIPPLDGGRFIVEIVQRLRHKEVTIRALNYMSIIGIAFFMAFFVVMLNQDVQRFVFNNWG